MQQGGFANRALKSIIARKTAFPLPPMKKEKIQFQQILD